MTVLKNGVVLWPPPPVATAPGPAPSTVKAATPSAAPAKSTAAAARPARKARASGHGGGHGAPAGESSSAAWWPILAAGLALFAVGWGAPPTFLTHLTVFVLACFIGYQVVWSVTPALHTPLMSVTNAISGIIVVGGMLQIGGGLTSAASVIGAAAIFLATLNISGGFLVTHRMLKMFRR
jgi:NAD(P) transhydrogenase subunit alpha